MQQFTYCVQVGCCLLLLVFDRERLVFHFCSLVVIAVVSETCKTLLLRFCFLSRLTTKSSRVECDGDNVRDDDDQMWLSAAFCR